MQKIIQDNIMMMKKIHFAQPSVQYADHQEHSKNITKLRKLVGFNSLRQCMISTVRNYFSGYDETGEGGRASIADRSTKISGGS